MSEMYSDVREDLRRQHAINRQEVKGKREAAGLYRTDYYGYSEPRKSAFSGLIFKGKIAVFLVSVMLFSCYLYGGQDVKKGAAMAWNDINTQITKLEEEEPTVKQAMTYVRKAYSEVKDFAQTYIGLELGDTENISDNQQ